MNIFKKKTLLITGGTGSFGLEATKILLQKTKLKKLIIFSRDENKQYIMQNKIKDNRIRFFIGDVRDEERLIMALRGVDYVIHAAAQKHVPSSEYNPFESIKTNIFGAQSLISASIKTKVKKVIALSTDKACNPINLYGATKLCSEKLFINGNQLSGKNGTRFSVVRYGNVIASRGSVIPFIKDLSKNPKNTIPLTHEKMTRFFITLNYAVNFVFKCLDKMTQKEIFIPKMNSILISDLIKVLCPKNRVKIIGIRPGEKIHETIFSSEETRNLYENREGFIILPDGYKTSVSRGYKKIESFSFSSDLKKSLNPVKIIKLINVQKNIVY